jgi:hypothetical protein
LEKVSKTTSYSLPRGEAGLSGFSTFPLLGKDFTFFSLLVSTCISCLTSSGKLSKRRRFVEEALCEVAVGLTKFSKKASAVIAEDDGVDVKCA